MIEELPLNKNQEQYTYLRGMFARISDSYNLMNRLMTFGRDIAWRRFLISIANIPRGGRLLDVGTGTGDITFEAVKFNPSVLVTGIDFTAEMMKEGQKRETSARIFWCMADAMQLPFADSTFDAVTSGFLLRNVADIQHALREQVRVVKPGGRVVCLDTSPAPRNILRPFMLFYFKVLIPILGRLITGDKDAYSYLYKSTLDFMEPEALAEIMKREGFEAVMFRRFMFGNIAVHWGTRPVPHSTIR